MKYLFLTIILLNTFLNVNSQPNARFEEVEAQNTISQNTVTSIYQDKLGFLWLGTTFGLNKYDGYKYKSYIFNKIENNQPASNRIVSLKADKNERFWITMYDGNVYRFNPETEKITGLGLKSGTILNSIHFTEDSLILCSTNNSGIFCIKETDAEDSLIIQHLFNDDVNYNIQFIINDYTGNIWFGGNKGLNQIKKNEIFTVTPQIENYYKNSSVEFTCAATIRNLIFFGTNKNGLIYYKQKTSGFETGAELLNEKINLIKPNNRNIWIGCNNSKLALADTNGQIQKIYQFSDKRSGKSINTIYISNENELWILTESFGITKFNSATEKFTYYELTPVERQKATDDERTIIYEDSKNNIWLCVQNMGIGYYNKTKDIFNFYSNDPQDPSSLVSDITQSIFQDRDGVFWIGTSWYGKGLNKMYILDEAFNYVQPFKKPVNKIQNYMRSAMEDSYGNFWLGTKDGEVFVYDKNFSQKYKLEKNNKKNYSGHNVYSIFEDAHGYIWLCTKGSGIYRSKLPIKYFHSDFKNISFDLFVHENNNINSLSNNNIYDITQDKYGRYWIATYGSGLDLLIFKGGKPDFTHYNTINSNISSDKLRDLYIDDNNRLWIATVYGLNYIDMLTEDSIKILNNFQWSKINQNISYNDVLMIAGDYHKNLWISTAGGGINLIKQKNDSIIIDHYTSQEGLKNNVAFSIVPDNFGDIWIGTENGLSRFLTKQGKFENIDDNNGLPVTQFSERTALLDSKNRLIFGTVDGFYIIMPDKVKNKPNEYPIRFTGFQLFNKDVVPGIKGSPLKKSISYTKEIVLKHNQSVFTIEFSALSYKSTQFNKFAFMLEGFDKDWNYVGIENKAAYRNIPSGEYTFKVRSTTGIKLNEKNEAKLKINILPPFWLSYKAFIIYIIIMFILAYTTIKIVLRFSRLKNNIKIERQVAESKLRFFTNISHEIRTPLTLIIGPLESIFNKREIDTEIKQQLNVIQRNSKRLLRMVNQLLDFRKVQNEKMELKVSKINIYKLIEQVYINFEMLARQKNIEYTLSCNNKLLNIYGDPYQLDAVFFNLLSNAFKFTADYKSIGVNIIDYPEADYIEIIISDTGIGIDPEKLPFIFDRFFVSHTQTNEKYYGSGIGLSLSQEYVKLHKGEISAESEPGKGTSFTVKLIKGKEQFSGDEIKENEIVNTSIDNIDLVFENKTENETEKDDQLSTVLIVEDDPDMILHISGILSKHFNVLQANNGLEGIHKASKELPDLILSDIMMPEMTGYELSKKLKENFNSCHIPLIFITAKTETEDQIEGFDSGAEAYISKPFNQEILISQIKSILQQRKVLIGKYENTVELKPDEIKVTSKDKIFIEKVLNQIEEHLEEPGFNVEKLVDELNISRTLFYKKITSITGYKPVELVRLIRLKRSYQLLETGEYNISEVAYMVGFNDIRYFSTCFKKEFGKSPSSLIRK